MEALILVLLLQAVICGLFCGYIASEKGRSYGAWFALGFFFSLLAVLSLIAIPKIDSSPHIPAGRSPPPPYKPLNNPTATPPQPQFDGPRKLDLPSYQLFLTRRFNIERNSTLDKFVIGDQVFGTLDDALAHADHRYGQHLDHLNRLAEQERQESQRKNEEAKRQWEQQRAEESRRSEDRERVRLELLAQTERRRVASRKAIIKAITRAVVLLVPVLGVIGFQIARERAEAQARCDGGEMPWLMKETADSAVLQQCGTGLLWTRSDNSRDVDWRQAQSYCRGIGNGSWSLPTVAQLTSLYREDLPGVQCGAHNCKVSESIRLSNAWVWSSELSNSLEVSTMYLPNGWINSYRDSISDGLRALCVRRP